MILLARVLLFSLPALAALVGGGALASWHPPSPALRSAILHFAAGVVFSVVAMELLPDIVKGHHPVPVVLGFVLGVTVMLGLKHFLEKGEGDESSNPAGVLTAVGVDISIDGLLLGIGFSAGAKEGMMLSFALALELLSLGLALTVQLRESKVSTRRILSICVGLGLLFVFFAALGATLLSHLPHFLLELVLSFGLAALHFLVTEELLVEAHEEKETPLLTASSFGGFLLFLILGMVN